MAEMTLSDLSEKMSDIDFCMLCTHSQGGQIAARPMSNNGDVEYEGDSWFFVSDDALSVTDIQSDPKVTLTFTGSKSLLGAPGIFIAIEGDAELISDKAQFEEHWTEDVDRYFPDGIESPNLLLLKVHASRIHYWNGEDEGEVRVPAA